MRRRLLASTLAVVVVAILLLGLPLGLLGTRLVQEEAQRRLEENAQRVAGAVEDRFEHHETPTQPLLIKLAGSGRQVVVLHKGEQYAAGPVVPEPRLEVSVTTQEGVRVRLTASARQVQDRIVRAWLVVGGLTLLSVAGAVALAVVQARRLGQPLESLAVAAARLGAGDTRPLGRRYGVPEIDRVADVLDSAAERLGDLLGREREFAANASHQLRTPLTALSIRLEEIAMATGDRAVRDEAEAGLAQVERLTGVVNQLLAGARDSRAGTAVPVDLGALLAEQVREWSPAYRRADRKIVLEAPANLVVAATPGSVGQVIASLLDNSLVHGAGTVTVRARPAAEHVVVEVTDEGNGVPPDLVPRIFERSVSGGSGTGLGLALARALVEADGGRLELVHARPPVFAAFLPAGPGPG